MAYPNAGPLSRCGCGAGKQRKSQRRPRLGGMGQSMHDKRRGSRRNKADNQAGQGVLRERADRERAQGRWKSWPESGEDRCENRENWCAGHEFRCAVPGVAEGTPKPALGPVAGSIFGPECGFIFGAGIRTHFWVPDLAPNNNSYERLKGRVHFWGRIPAPKTGPPLRSLRPQSGAACAPFRKACGGAPMVELRSAAGSHWEGDLAHGCGQGIHLPLVKRQQRRNLHEQVEAAPEVYFAISGRDIPSISKVERLCGTPSRQRCCMTTYFGSRQQVGAWA